MGKKGDLNQGLSLDGMCRYFQFNYCWNDMIQLTSTSIMIPSCAGWRMLLTNCMTSQLFFGHHTVFSEAARANVAALWQWLFARDSPTQSVKIVKYMHDRYFLLVECTKPNMRWCLCHKSWYKPPLQHGLGQLCLAPARVIGPTDAGSGASCTRHDPSGRGAKAWAVSGLNLHVSGIFDYIPSILAVGGCNWCDFFPLLGG